ncbi:MarR family winged helix-turn-helix transcriptional regulator [Gordonia effusa]|uniref:MarR family winged helix-turn-helix transcriptional regulator n=1 Tax=Gordonia effusa TaxID=263908 RepID=UPI000318076F|nr:MarR family transcriptional regulator [Gordonia effusa]
MTDDQLALNQQLCFALYAASRATTAVYRPMLDELGVTYPQYLVLLVLWERDGRGVREIGDELDLDSGTLSPLLKRLETLGLIERRRLTIDERRVEIHLSDAGRKLRERAVEIPACLAARSGMSIAEAVALRESLVKLTASFRDQESTNR